MLNILLEGTQLMLFGMAFVYFYLLLMIWGIQITTKFMKPITDREEAENNKKIQEQTKRSLAKETVSEEDELIVAAITAAIATHRRSKVH